jgi:hypothetical protein
MIVCKSDSQSPTEPEPVTPPLSWLYTDNNRLVNEEGEMMVLRGVNRSGLEYDKQGNGMDKEEIDYICQVWKAQIIRIPFNQEWIITDTQYDNFLDQVISWIVANNAYVLLDLQWQNTQVKIPPIPNEEAVDMWKILAERYKENPAVLYDIHNEAHNTTWAAWRARAIEIIEGIRSVHSRALIFVSGLDWAYDIRGWGQNPLPYDNIVYATHPYPFKAEPWAWDKYFGDYVDDIPIFVGEFGGWDEDLEWGTRILDYFDQKQLGWTAWSWVDQPFLTEFDRRTPTAFGNLVYNALLRHSLVDSAQLEISNIQINFVTDSKATINWETNREADSRVNYGLTVNYTDSVYAPVMLTTHTMKLTDLQSGTTYHFQIVSRDQVGWSVFSGDSTFTTL